MSAEIWRSETILYGFIFLNLFATAAGLAWAWRRGLLSDLDATMRTALDLTPDPTSQKEHGHGR